MLRKASYCGLISPANEIDSLSLCLRLPVEGPLASKSFGDDRETDHCSDSLSRTPVRSMMITVSVVLVFHERGSHAATGAERVKIMFRCLFLTTHPPNCEKATTDGNASDPILSRGVTAAQLHPSGGGVQRRSAIAHSSD